MKTKKYGRGGNIAGALAAGLLGFALGRGKGEESDKGGFRPLTREQTDKIKPREDEAASSEDKELTKRGKFPYEAGDETSGAGLADKPANKNVAPRPVVAKKTVTPAKSPSPAVNIPSYKDAKQGRTIERQVMGVPDRPVDMSVPKGIDLKGTNKTVYGTDTTSVFQKRAAQDRAEAEAKAKKKAKDAAQAKEFRDRPLQPLRKGGAVKKYAAGGSVSSASKRADGIAIRGKTRGKVC